MGILFIYEALDKNFRKQYRKADQSVQRAFRKRLQLFMKDEHYFLLRNHKLSGKYAGYRSINITGDWRALFSEQEEKHGRVVIKKVATFEYFGTHSQLYKG